MIEEGDKLKMVHNLSSGKYYTLLLIDEDGMYYMEGLGGPWKPHFFSKDN